MTYSPTFIPKGPPRAGNRSRDLLRDLVERAWHMNQFDKMDPQFKPKPGETILKLPEGQRKWLRDLKSEDIKVDHWPRLR